MRERKIVILLSGGLDSAVLLHHLKSQGYEPHALSILYGQRHKREVNAAREIAELASAPHMTADISAAAALFSGSALTSSDIEVPHGHYTDDSMKITVVPNRNMVFLSLAGALACSLKARGVAYAAHTGDHAIYPDCRPSFAQTMREALGACDWSELELLTPFIDRSKRDIVTLGHSIGVPFERTWSCYEGGDLHCGRCGTCVERKEAFAEARISDPTIYSA